jgi:hypothetical protein
VLEPLARQLVLQQLVLPEQAPELLPLELLPELQGPLELLPEPCLLRTSPPNHRFR